MIMRETSCALCNSKTSYRIIYNPTLKDGLINEHTFSARRIPDRLHYRIVRCKRCGLHRSNPIYKPEQISMLYKKSTLRYETEIPYLKKTYGRYLKRITPLLESRHRLLDIGCGNGFFLQEAQEQGFKSVFGVEPGESVQQASPDIKKHITLDFFHGNLFPKNYFDLVSCFHLLDHVVDPNQFLKDVRIILKPHGYGFFITHNVSSLLPRLLRQNCPIFDIEHIYLFDKKTLRKIFEKNNFEVINVFTISNTYPLSYYLYMSPLSFGIKQFVTNVLTKFTFLNLPLTIPIGNIGIVVKKR